MDKKKNSKPIYELHSDHGSIGTKIIRGETYEIHLRWVSWYGHKMWELRCENAVGDTSKGFTMHTEQLKTLRDILDLIDFEEYKE